MQNRRVVITGMGTVNPLGHDVDTTWKGILTGEMGPTPVEVFDASTFPTTFASQVKNFKLEEHIESHEKHATAGRHCKFAIAAANQAWKQSGLGQFEELDRSRVGVYLGSGEGSLDFENFISLIVEGWDADNREVNSAKWLELAKERLNMYREMEQDSNMVVAHLAAEFDVTGPAFNVLTACAASTQAIGEAVMQVRYGLADTIITGGAHSMIHPLGMTGFNRLTALSQRNDDIAHSSRPFDLTRDGFVLGEGASILIIETLEQAQKRGATILAEVVGYGASADAFRITDQDPEGEGAASSMRAALADAELTPADIDYISAHGTGTKQNDQVETLAIKAAMGENAPTTPVSSVKSMLGHLIAAAGATELITCILAIQDQMLPPTANLNTPDPDCDLDYIANEPRSADINICMSNSMGFGGQNNTIIIKKYEG